MFIAKQVFVCVDKKKSGGTNWRKNSWYSHYSPVTILHLWNFSLFRFWNFSQPLELFGMQHDAWHSTKVSLMVAWMLPTKCLKNWKMGMVEKKALVNDRLTWRGLVRLSEWPWWQGHVSLNFCHLVNAFHHPWWKPSSSCLETMVIMVMKFAKLNCKFELHGNFGKNISLRDFSLVGFFLCY